MMKMLYFRLLGAYPYNNQGTTGYLLQSDGFNLLIDAGSATLIKLQEHLDPLDLDAVMLAIIIMIVLLTLVYYGITGNFIPRDPGDIAFNLRAHKRFCPL